MNIYVYIYIYIYICGVATIVVAITFSAAIDVGASESAMPYDRPIKLRRVARARTFSAPSVIVLALPYALPGILGILSLSGRHTARRRINEADKRWAFDLSQNGRELK